jgi:sigma-B regulation protein RsbU (phosphoserine phosphatase)
MLSHMKMHWKEELRIVNRLMRAVSKQTDPQKMVNLYAEGVGKLYPADDFLALSRRELEYPFVRITRSDRFEEDINPWEQRDRLPLIQGGLLSELAYGNRPRVIANLQPDPSDPAYSFISGMRAMLCLPQYDNGQSLNLAVIMFKDRRSIRKSRVPTQLWQANLFGRATLNMVLRRQLSDAYRSLDRELQTVGDIQRSLLPQKLPRIHGLELAAHYETSQRAGGDYYDLFPLSDGTWGIIMADVSGHGTPAAVMMAVTHAIAHTHPGEPMPPSAVLRHLNERLTALYTRGNGTFVTAFYLIVDPKRRRLRFACAGHNPPRLRHCDGRILSLEGKWGMPLGVAANETFEDNELQLGCEDLIVLYTDGIVEAMNPAGEQFGLTRLDACLASRDYTAGEHLDNIRQIVREFSAGRAANDDRTLFVVRFVDEPDARR